MYLHIQVEQTMETFFINYQKHPNNTRQLKRQQCKRELESIRYCGILLKFIRNHLRDPTEHYLQSDE